MTVQISADSTDVNLHQIISEAVDKCITKFSTVVLIDLIQL